jgi:diacylglycerol kinase (ATP)
MRFHFLTVVLVLMAGIFFRLDSVHMSILVIVSSGVIIAEMINTAVESVVDMITQSYNPLAKLAKDIAAGAVLIAAINAAIVGIIIFVGENRIQRMQIGIDRGPKPLELVLILGVLVLVLVLCGKVLGGKGSILSGGVISGHAAVSFCLAATIIYRANDYFIAVIALLLAFLVAQSRVEGKIHTIKEVIIGGLLGITMSGGAFFFHLVK